MRTVLLGKTFIEIITNVNAMGKQRDSNLAGVLMRVLATGRMEMLPYMSHRKHYVSSTRRCRQTVPDSWVT